MNTLTKLLVLISMGSLVACGGGGGEAGDPPNQPPTNQAPPPAALSNATSYTQFLDQVMSRHFNVATMDRLRTYDNDYMSFPDTMMLLDTNGRRPIGRTTIGEIDDWEISVAPGQGFANEHPIQTATMRLTPTGNPRILGYEAFDFFTGLSGEGEAKVYWGIKNIDYTRSPHMPIVLVIEQIVKNKGVAQYRGISIIEGYLLAPLTPSSLPALGIRANYTVYAVEAFNNGATGELTRHRICLKRGGFIGSAYQPSGNWCN